MRQLPNWVSDPGLLGNVGTVHTGVISQPVIQDIPSVNCGQEFEVETTASTPVGDCQNLSDDEIATVVEGAAADAIKFAGGLCRLNPNCPRAQLIRLQKFRVWCEGNRLTLTLTAVFKCIRR